MDRPVLIAVNVPPPPGSAVTVKGWDWVQFACSTKSPEYRVKCLGVNPPANPLIATWQFFPCNSTADLREFLQQSEPQDLGNTVVALNVSDWIPAQLENSFQPVGGSPWGQFALELVLLFPQLLCLFFIGVKEAHKEYVKEICGASAVSPLDKDAFDLHLVSDSDELSERLCRFANGYRSLFDASGLRTITRQRALERIFGGRDDLTNQEVTEKFGSIWDRANHLVVSIDEESEVSSLLAYAGYKFGSRALAINSYASFNEFFESESHRTDPSPLFKVEPTMTIVRDLDLRFPDYPDHSQGVGLRKELENARSPAWKVRFEQLKHWQLTKLKVRVLSGGRFDIHSPPGKAAVTHEPDYGQTDASTGDDASSSRTFVGDRKPIASLHALAELVHPVTDERHYSAISNIKSVGSGMAPGGHAAPYVNLALAQFLIAQARRTARSGSSAKDFIVGAVLAQDAYSLLGGMSRSVALDALLEMHRLETMAEIASSGISEFDGFKARKRDLDHTLVNLNGPNDDAGHSRFFRSRVWSVLKVLYRKGDQFTAAEWANIEALANNSKWLGRYAIGREILRWIANCATSPLVWLITAFVFTVIMTLLYKEDSRTIVTWLTVVSKTITFQGWWEHPSPYELVLETARELGGFVLFGLLVSLITRRLSRGS